MGTGGLRMAARMCQGAAIARKTRVEGMRWSLREEAELAGEGEVEDDEGERGRRGR